MPDSNWLSKGSGLGRLKTVDGRIGGGREGSWKFILHAVLFWSLEAGLVSCTALPGGSLDPLVPALGLHRGEESLAQPRPEPQAPAQPLPPAPQPSPVVRPPSEAPTRSDWIGRYRDNRGEGEIALNLTQDASALGGTWRLRTGGSGTFAGTLAPDGRTLSFSMRGSDRGCVTTLEGIAEYTGDRISGSYRGSDCHGVVGEGRLKLQKR